MASAATERVAVAGAVATLTDEREIFLETTPQKGEGLLALTRRLTGDGRNAAEVARINGDVRKLLAGVRYRVPLRLLLPDLQRRVITALFPRDRARADGWVHEVSRQESLWSIAEWFTGRGESFAAIRAHNRMSDDSLTLGQTVVIPAGALLPAFAAALPSTQTFPGLEYERREEDSFAIYRLKAGEALYSSVVVRFTGRTYADDVNALAAELATLNGIPDVTDISIGQEIRIPFDLLLPEFLPPDDPRRQAYEQALSESARFSNTVHASRLEGITVILDAGHGGKDPGAIKRDVWESVYVYDIMLRVKKLLEATTAARVIPTIRDGRSFQVLDRDVLPLSRGHEILTSPSYPIENAVESAHLRWYLANSLFSKAVKKYGDTEKVIFISIHADSLHPSLRGAMAYIPAASLTQGTYGKLGAVYKARQEVRERPKVTFTYAERVKSEGLSRELADHLLRSFVRSGLAVHPEKPIRDRIVRCRRCRPYVPAVIRYNAIPAKVLFEVCNLNNSEDRRLLLTGQFRQKVAETLVTGILDYYGQNAPSPP